LLGSAKPPPNLQLSLTEQYWDRIAIALPKKHSSVDILIQYQG
jgi:hypothetical protein